MSGKEIPVNGNIPRIPEEHVEDEDAESMGSGNEERVEELQEIERPPPPPLETESVDSGLDSPLEYAIGSSLDSGNDSPLEGAVGGELPPSCDVEMTLQERSRIEPGKEDIFRKFFNQPNAPILGRRRHPDLRQRPEDSNINPLRSLQSIDIGDKFKQNRSEITRENIPMENIQDFSRFGTKNDCSLPSMGTREDLDCSVRSRRHVLIEPGPPSDDSRRGLSQGSSSMSISSRQTASTDNMQTSPLLYSTSPEGDSETVAQEKPVRRRKIGVVAHPMLVRSKSAGTSAGIPPDGYHKKKVSEAMSICSEPLRKISKDSSADSYEPMSLEDDTINYPELSHSLESEPCLPMPDLDPEAIENLAALTVSSAVATDDAAEPKVKEEIEESVSEQDATVTDLSDSRDARSSHKPQSD